MNILQKIFTDHYEEIKYTLHPRDTEMENIEKMIHCGDSTLPLAVPCIIAPIVATLNMSLSTVTVGFAFLVETNTAWNAPLL